MIRSRNYMVDPQEVTWCGRNSTTGARHEQMLRNGAGSVTPVQSFMICESGIGAKCIITTSGAI